MPTVFERVRQIVAKQLGVEEEQVVPNASLVDDLQADSLDLVELVMALEEEFSDAATRFEIPDEDAERLVTVQDVADYINERGAQGDG